MSEATAPDAIPNPYPLKHPVETVFKGHEGERTEILDEVTMRRPNGEDLLLLDQYQARPMHLMLEMIARLSGLPMKQVKRLDAEDLGPLGELAFANVDPGRSTGATS